MRIAKVCVKLGHVGQAQLGVNDERSEFRESWTTPKPSTVKIIL